MNMSNATPIWTNVYTYDDASRLQSVSDGVNSANYTYLANSSLVGQTTFKHGATVEMATTKQYDYLDRLTAISSVPSGAGQFPLSYAYGYNAANQRVSRTDSDGPHWNYGYDSLGQVTNGTKYWADGNPVPGEQFGYAFDDIGNRMGTTSGGNSSGTGLRTASYTVNDLNQYSNRTVPNGLDILGIANYQATVTINGLSTDYRRGEFYQKALTITNSSNPAWLSVTNTSTYSSSSSNVVGSTWTPATPEVFGYDNDGNLTNDGRFYYYWDAENRLTNITSISGAPVGSLVKVDSTYDYMGRRIQKIASTNNGSSWVASSTNKFVYAGWNIVAILDGGNQLIQTFVWGSDLSGSLQGAGGIGGLISTTVWTGSNAGTYFYCYDGNGSLVALASATDGTIVAQFEHDSFGRLIRATGRMAQMAQYLFQTEYYDWESGKYQWKHRYYDPETGRWLNRDPIEEAGGVNLYGFLRNDSINGIDPLGFWGPDAPDDIDAYISMHLNAQEMMMLPMDLREQIAWREYYYHYKRIYPNGVRWAHIPDEEYLDQQSQRQKLLWGASLMNFQTQYQLLPSPISTTAPTVCMAPTTVETPAPLPASTSSVQVEKLELPPYVIGRNMKDRVIPFAKTYGFDYYQPGPELPTIEENLAANQAEIEQVIASGRIIIDIGLDPANPNPSLYYTMESQLVNENAVPVISLYGFQVP